MTLTVPDDSTTQGGSSKFNLKLYDLYLEFGGSHEESTEICEGKMSLLEADRLGVFTAPLERLCAAEEYLSLGASIPLAIRMSVLGPDSTFLTLSQDNVPPDVASALTRAHALRWNLVIREEGVVPMGTSWMSDESEKIKVPVSDTPDEYDLEKNEYELKSRYDDHTQTIHQVNTCSLDIIEWTGKQSSVERSYLQTIHPDDDGGIYCLQEEHDWRLLEEFPTEEYSSSFLKDDKTKTFVCTECGAYLIHKLNVPNPLTGDNDLVTIEGYKACRDSLDLVRSNLTEHSVWSFTFEKEFAASSGWISVTGSLTDFMSEEIAEYSSTVSFTGHGELTPDMIVNGILSDGSYTLYNNLLNQGDILIDEGSEYFAEQFKKPLLELYSEFIMEMEDGNRD